MKILRQKRVYDDFLKIDEAVLQYEKFNGDLSREVRRLSLRRGDAVAAVIHHLEDDSLLLVRQFRYPTVEKCGGWVTELAAGILAPGEDPEKAMRRELEEELGYRVGPMQYICEYFASPGGSDERLTLFFGMVTEADKVSSGGGLEEEGEDIRIEVLPVKQVAAYLDQNQIHDAKTYMGLSWFLRHHFNEKQ